MGIRLETERLVLRLPRLDDASGAAEYLTDPQVMRFLGGETVARKDAAEVVQKWLDRWEENGVGHFVLERRSDGRFLGRVGLVVWDTRTWRHTTFSEEGGHAQPELGWTLVRAHWGQGYATEAARAVRDWVYRERRIERLISLIAPENAASQRLARRLGARPTKTVTLFDSGDAVIWDHPRDAAFEETITLLEMTSPRQLVPGRPPPARLELQEVGSDAVRMLRSTYVRIGAPLGWTGRATWSDAEWEEELSRPGVRAWLARVEEEVIGLVELEAEPNGDVGIVVFGLVPEFVGKGFGGTFLTLATRLAWEVTSPGGVPARRVWVQTSSRDHPHARRNYESRGFRTFRPEPPPTLGPPEFG